MKILNFRVKNHTSVRDEVALELLDPSFNRLTPAEGKTWNQYVHNVASIFGANASGKTNLALFFKFFKDSVCNGIPMEEDILSRAVGRQ